MSDLVRFLVGEWIVVGLMIITALVKYIIGD